MALKSNHKGLVLLLLFMLFSYTASYSQHADIKHNRSEANVKDVPDHIYSKDTAYAHKLIRSAGELRYHNTDRMAQLAHNALKLCHTIGYSEGAINARLLLAAYYSDQGQSQQAIEELELALSKTKEGKYTALEIKTLNDLGNEWGYKGQNAKSLRTYLEAIELAKATDNKPMLSVLYENVANVYADQKDYDEALQYYGLVKKKNESIGNEIFIAETNSNLASIYADMGKLDYAMFHVNKSIATFEKSSVLEWLAYAYEIKGKTYLKEGDFKWALYWYNQAKILQEKLHDDRGKIDLFNGIAEAYLGQEQDSLAEDYALQSMRLADRIHYMDGQLKCTELLYRLSKNKEDLLCALEYHEQYLAIYDTLSKNKTRMSMELLKTKTAYERQKETLISENEKALAKQKRYINFTLFIMLIIGIIAFLMFRSRRIHQQLNVKLSAQKDILEEREKQLEENNATKTKLFSIIGHDLRGPIGALQGLLNMFSNGDIGKEEFLDLIPKLRRDIDHISFTLNNLLSWGHTQLNGAKTKPALLTLETIVNDNINLLSEQASSKSIRIISKLAGNTHSWADENQIDIVLRNLISNAIKFTPENGMITIGAKEFDQHWEISVRDTGVGMTEQVRNQLFTKNTHTSTHGTQNEKGTGLGLSLCKEMVEKNQGTIWVESTPRKGSCFYFTLPKAKGKFRKAS